MAGAVIEVEARAPQKLPRKRIELRAAGAVREYRTRDGNVALEHEREALAKVIGSRAHDHGAGDVGGAVLVLAAGIDQKQLTRRDAAVALAGHAIVHDGSVGAGARDGGERNVFQLSGIAAETLQRLDRVDFGQAPRR